MEGLNAPTTSGLSPTGQAIFNDNELALVVKVVIKGLASFFLSNTKKSEYLSMHDG